MCGVKSHPVNLSKGQKGKNRTRAQRAPFSSSLHVGEWEKRESRRKSPPLYDLRRSGSRFQTGQGLKSEYSARAMCKTLENSNFLKKRKMVISVKILNFSKSWMMKWNSSLESSRKI